MTYKCYEYNVCLDLWGTGNVISLNRKHSISININSNNMGSLLKVGNYIHCTGLVSFSFKLYIYIYILIFLIFFQWWKPELIKVINKEINKVIYFSSQIIISIRIQFQSTCYQNLVNTMALPSLHICSLCLWAC